MTAVANELRPGLGWLVLAAAGVLLAGAALMLAVLPSANHRFVTSTAGDERSQTDTLSRRACPTPIASAFDGIGSTAGWFDVGTGEPIVISPDSYCTISARQRLSLAVVAGIAGPALIGVGARGRIGTRPTMPSSQ